MEVETDSERGEINFIYFYDVHASMAPPKPIEAKPSASNLSLIHFSPTQPAFVDGKAVEAMMVGDC